MPQIPNPYDIYLFKALIETLKKGVDMFKVDNKNVVGSVFIANFVFLFHTFF